MDVHAGTGGKPRGEQRLFLWPWHQHRWGRVRGLGGTRMPFVAPAGQTAQLLPVPRDTHWGVANSINSFGEIVGILEIYRIMEGQ